MKFRNFLLTLTLAFCTFGLFGQNLSESPVSQGQFMVGTTDIVNTGVSDISLGASAGYVLTDQIVVGLSGLQGDGDNWNAGVFGRYYLSSPFYAQAQANYDSETEDTNLGVGFGVTGFLTNWLYVEPNVGIDFGDDTTFGFGLNLGVRF